MIIDWEGRKYALDFEEITISQAEALEDYTGRPLGEWLEQLDQGAHTSVKILRPVCWLMLAQNANGEQPPPIGTLDFKLLRFAEAFDAAELTEAERRTVDAAGQPDPTRAAPSAETASKPPTPKAGSPAATAAGG